MHADAVSIIGQTTDIYIDNKNMSNRIDKVATL
jgi:hypothetical protein